jgi:hypothetical protein
MSSNKKLLVALIVIVALNLSWEHQSLLIPQLTTHDYYHFEAREPFIYRILPALIYRAAFSGHPDRLTGLNAPFDSSVNIFQLFLDALCLCMTFVLLNGIVQRLNSGLHPWLTRAIAGATGVMIVVFGFFMVPNRAFFYPYDFPDLCLATLIFYLCIRLEGRYEYLLPIAIFIATLNKETAIYYSGLYLALRAAPKADWGRITAVLALCGAAFITARVTVNWLVHRLHGGGPIVNQQYEYHLMYTLAQMTNPLFVFSILNICSYLYVVIYLLRRRLDRTDGLILAMIAGWVIIMSTVGIIRELRIFVPASLMMFVILARHLQAVVDTWSPVIAARRSRSPQM